MKTIFLVLLILLIEFRVINPLNQGCTRRLNSFTNIFEQCNPSDYCLALDSERSHTKLFSTKTAYQTEKSYDQPRDFQIDGE